MDFKITQGTAVDLLEPFPLPEIKRIFGWSRPNSLGSLIITDDSTINEEDFTAFMHEVLAASRGFAIIDKDHAVSRAEIQAPLVGIVIVKPASPYNAYLHIAARSKAAKLVREAGRMVVDQIFESEPKLLRLSAWIADGNKPAKLLARRAGLLQEGKMPDWATCRNEPVEVVHFGLTRRAWKKWDSLPLSSPPLHQEPETSSLADATLPAGKEVACDS